MRLIIDPLIAGLFSCVGFFVFVNREGDPDGIAGWFFAGGWVITCVIPCSIVHVQYYLRNRNMKVKVDKAGRTFTIEDGESSYLIRFNEIHYIRITIMPNLYRGASNGILPFESYYYSTLETTAGKRFIITRLLIYNQLEFFTSLGYKLPVIKEKTIFPTIDSD